MDVRNCNKMFCINNKLKDCLTLVIPDNSLMKFLGSLPDGNIYMRVNSKPGLTGVPVVFHFQA